ncbi:MAG: serine--tRNA ligase [Chloroflexi bacterium]|nr:serine--tRNA ligase [Chloroflexota bacterium]
MLDIGLIRDNPAFVKDGLVRLGADPTAIDRVAAMDLKRRETLTEVEALRAERNRVSKEIAQMKDPVRRQVLIDEMREVGDRIAGFEGTLGAIESDLNALMLTLPNLPHASVSVGPDESHNVVVGQWGEPHHMSFEPVPHWDLGPELGIIDFERGVKLSGSRFYLLRGAGARLQRALIAWMLDVHTSEHGYTEIYPPYVVREECMWGAGQLPKFIDNIYRDVEDDLWLVGTAEIPLTNIHRDEILEAADLPLNYVAYSACFRREKMSAGRDVRGIKRGHQFDKVEMYKLTSPESSYAELDAMVEDALEICRRLGLPHRLVQMCTGDLGFQAAKKFDIEVWAPGCQEWLEVSSLSNCEEFQARRANLRYRPEPGARPRFVHTLNGSGLALPRIMIAVMENYQQSDGAIAVPDVLRPWMGGIDVIGA